MPGGSFAAMCGENLCWLEKTVALKARVIFHGKSK